MKRESGWVECLAIMPWYMEDGKNVAKIIDKEGKEHYSKTSFKSTLKKFLLAHGVCLETNHVLVSPYLMQTKLLPIYLGAGHIMIPFCTEVCEHTGEVANGYVFSHAIESLEESRIHLHNGVTLQTCNMFTTLRTRYLTAESLTHRLESKAHRMGSFQLT